LPSAGLLWLDAVGLALVEPLAWDHAPVIGKMANEVLNVSARIVRNNGLLLPRCIVDGQSENTVFFDEGTY
jgi:hypothetical protein